MANHVGRDDELELGLGLDAERTLTPSGVRGGATPHEPGGSAGSSTLPVGVGGCAMASNSLLKASNSACVRPLQAPARDMLAMSVSPPSATKSAATTAQNR